MNRDFACLLITKAHTSLPARRDWRAHAIRRAALVAHWLPAARLAEASPHQVLVSPTTTGVLPIMKTCRQQAHTL